MHTDEANPLMFHIPTAMSHTLMEASSSYAHTRTLQPLHTLRWSLLPSYSHTYSHITPNCGASYHHVHTLTATSHPTVELPTLTATSHPTVEPPTIMFTHLQPHHTQLWSLLPSCSHTYSHITPNCGASYHHVHTLTAMSHPTMEHFYSSHTYSLHTLICT